MTRTGQAAIDYAEARVGELMPDGAGYCLKFTRQCFDVASYYYNATDAANGADYWHGGDRTPGDASPVWFEGSSIDGHVAFHARGGRVISTYNDEIRAYDSIAAAEAAFGPVLGWAEDLNEVRVWHAPAPPDPAPEPRKVLPEMFVTTYGGSVYRLVTGGHIVGIGRDTFEQLRDAGIPAVALFNKEVEHLTAVLIGEDGTIGGTPIPVDVE